MRVTWKPGVIERLRALYSHLSTHAKFSCRDEAVCSPFVPGKRAAVTQIDGNSPLTSADNNREAEALKNRRRGLTFRQECFC